MNHPAPESGALRMAVPKLSYGGFIVFDDYRWWGYSAQIRLLDLLQTTMAAAHWHSHWAWFAYKALWPNMKLWYSSSQPPPRPLLCNFVN